MRDFQYNEEEMKADKEEMTRLSTDKKKQFVSCYPFFTSNVYEISNWVYLLTLILGDVVNLFKEPHKWS